ncbi:MAG: PAS domain S-box protein, partial [Spirochaetaceae bacterium]|nr:PAS domain S-box protein [Spirochaetaceae bacterium]
MAEFSGSQHPVNQQGEKGYLYKKIISNIGDVIAIIDKEGINRYKSPNLEKYFGWKPEELLGKESWNNIHPDDLEETQAFFKDLLLHPFSVGTIECRYRCKDGSYTWIEFKGRNLTEDKEIQGILGNYHDISLRKKAEEALQESETRFKALHNASSGGIAIHDKGIILDCNKGLADISGFTVDELLGMDGLLLIAEKSRDIVMANILNGFEKPYEVYGLRKNGQEYPLRIAAKQIPYKGKTVRTVEFRDITDIREDEVERIRLQNQLVQAQKMDSIGRLAGGVAHDFNNMLGVILGYAELALEEVEDSSSIHYYLMEIDNAAERSMKITNQLLAFARKQTVTPSVIDLNKTITKMLKMLQRLVGENISLNWKPGEDLWPIKIDPSQIDQILANLCINSRDAIKDQGQISISTENYILEKQKEKNPSDLVPGDYVQITIGDNGLGMSSDVLENLFEPFYTTKDQYKGTGLGLATVYGIIKQNKGFIWVNSDENQGTSFKIFIPANPNEKIVEIPLELKQQTPIARKGETILLVEDETAILKMTESMLTELGYLVIAYSNPEAALKDFSENPRDINLLISDIIMPGINGKDLSEEFLKIIPGIKILFISGYTAD